MAYPVSIVIDGKSVAAELNDTETALMIIEKLPIETGFNTWGDEIYFGIPVSAGLDDGRDVVAKGDLAYWPPGNAFCIFFGATPGSTEEEIRPASPVTIIGRVPGDVGIFRKLVKRASVISIEKA